MQRANEPRLAARAHSRWARSGLGLTVLFVLVVLPGLASAAPSATAMPPVTSPVALLDLKDNIAPAQADGIVAAMTIRGRAMAQWFGRAATASATELDQAMAQAQQAMAALACNEVAIHAARATALALADVLRGANHGPALKTALRYQLLCADQTGRVDDAMYLAERLRAARHLVGAAADDDTLDRTLLARYPALDAATDREIVPLTITVDDTSQANTEIWIDMQRRGIAPLATFVSVGHHMVAAVRNGQAVAVDYRIEPRTAAVQLPLSKAAPIGGTLAPGQGNLPAPAAALLLQWRNGNATAEQQQLVVAAVAAAMNAKRVLVFDGPASTAWHPIGATDGQVTFIAVGATHVRTTDELTTLADRASGSNAKLRAPAPDQPLLLDSALPKRDASDGEPTKWWVYASVLGAVAAGAAIIYAQDASTDHQTIQVRW